MTRTLFTGYSVCLFVFATLMAQSGRCQSADCNVHHDKALKEYEAKRYREALDEFQRTDGCELTKYQYYNGAFIAALCGDKKLAFFYLQKAINLGYNNLDHMSKDSDLNGIRNDPEYARLVHSIETRYDGINKYFDNVAGIEDLVPYYKNGKWGWLDKGTLKTKTAALFDYADFPTAYGLDFGYRGKNFRYTIEKKVIEPNDDIIPNIEIMNGGPTPVHGMRGFEVDQDGLLTNYSDKYRSIELVRRSRGSNEMLGIATDSALLKGVINSAGDTVKGFGFRYADIQAIIDVFGYPRFLAKKRGQSFFQFYYEGKVIYPYRITDHKSLTKYQSVRGDQMHYRGAGFEGIEGIKVDAKWYIVYVSNGKKITDKGYDDVWTLNGPAYERDRYGELRRGNLPDYYLVKEGSDFFYIDKDGKEYRSR